MGRKPALSATVSLALRAGLLAAVLPGGRAHAQAALPAPVIFEPGVISGPANDGAPTFSPDGKMLLFERSNNSWSLILDSHLTGERWSKPEIAAFSGPSSDQQPCFSPDGTCIVYASSRISVTDAPRSTPVKLVTHLWKAERTDLGWSEPAELPNTVNITSRVFKPSIAANGDLYFMAEDGSGGANPAWRLYRSAFVHGTYETATPLSFSDGKFPDVDPAIAPDQSYIVFSSKGRRAPEDQEHLFTAFRDGGKWGAVTPIRYDGDNWGGDDGEAQISRDGRTLYFISSRSQPIHRLRKRAEMLEDFARLETWDNGNTNVWTLPLEPYLKHAP